MRSGVYAIENATNGKMYVGSSIDVLGRCREHTRLLRLGKHPNPHLQRAWDRYGNDAFTFRTLEVCRQSELLVREQHHIDSRQRSMLYNLRLQADSMLGYKHTQETCAKFSLVKLGVPLKPGHRAAIGRTHQGMKHRHSTESIAKLRAIQTGRRYDADAKKKMRDAKLGRSWKVVGGKRVWSQPCQH